MIVSMMSCDALEISVSGQLALGDVSVEDGAIGRMIFDTISEPVLGDCE